MRLTQWRVIASAAVLSAALTGCYTPHSSIMWTPEKARAAILKEEQSHVCGTGGITPESLQVTDEYFDYFYCASTHTRRQGNLVMTTRTYRTRRIYFRDIKDVRIRWDAVTSIIVPPFLFGLMGPFAYDRMVVFESGKELILTGSPKWELLNWAWLWVIPVRPFLHSDPYTEAILYMSNRARQTRTEPSSE